MMAKMFTTSTKTSIHCHSALVLERLFRYMFQEDFGVIENKTIKT
jgi:hypothetical protein